MAEENKQPSLLDQDIPVPQPISRVEMLKADMLAQTAREDVEFGEALSAAYQTDNMMAYLFKDNPEFEFDPNFTLTDELYDKATAGIPTEFHGFAADAVSEHHLMRLRENVQESLNREETLANYGWSGVGLRMAMSVLDPAAIAATVATEGVVAPLVWGGKATRLARALRGSASGAVSNAGIEAYLVSQNEVKDAYDILYGAAAGFLLGGAFGAMGKNKLPEYDDALEKVAKDAHTAQVYDYANSPKVMDLNGGQPLNTPKSVGAAQNPMSSIEDAIEIRTDLESHIEASDGAPMSIGGKVRISMSGQTKSSPLSIARDYMGRYLEDGAGRNAGNERMRETAEMRKRQNFQSIRKEFYDVYGPAYEEWLTSIRGKSIGTTLQARYGYKLRKEFGELVSDAVENPNLPVHPAVRRAANKDAQLKAKLLGMNKAANTKGFETIPEDLTYLTRAWNPEKIAAYVGKYGDDGRAVARVLQKSLMQANINMDEDFAKGFAEGLVKNFRKRAVGMEAGLARAFTTDSKDVLRDILIEEGLLEPEGADQLIKLLSTSPDGTPTQAMRRLKMDMNASEVMPDGSVIKIKDLVDRDAEQLFNRYADQMTGMEALSRAGIFSDADHARMLDRVRAEADRVGEEGRKVLERDIENLDVAYHLIRGRPSPMQDDINGKFARSMRLIMDWNFLRLMGQVGFAQVAELGNVLSLGGWRGLLQVMPDMKAMVKRARNGEVEDDVAREFEAATGYGSDRYINQFANMRDIDRYYEGGRGDLIDKALDVMQPMKRILADLSGMSWITLGLERAASKIVIQNFTDMAYGTRKINMERLLGLGIDQPMANRIFEHLTSDRVVSVPSTLFRNRKIKRVNFDLWEDDVREAFLNAVFRQSRQAVQQNDFGNLNRYMTKTNVQLFTQFRTFTLVAYEKQLMHNIAAKDGQATLAMLYSTFFAGSAYVLQTTLNSVGREDQEEFLEERLSNKAIAAAAFQRASYATLVPAMIDTGAMFIMDDPIFAYGRSTGLSSNLIQGIPAVDLVDDVFKASTGVSKALLNPDVQWSQGHQKAFNSVLFMQNATGIRNGLEYMVDIMPETSVAD